MSDRGRGSGGESHVADERLFPSGNESHVADERLFPAGHESHVADERLFPSGHESHVADERLFPSGHESHVADERLFRSGNETHVADERLFPSGHETHVADERIFPSGNETHVADERLFPSGNERRGSGEPALPSGNESHASGEPALPSGNEGHASGDDALPSGNESHASGDDALPSGNECHASGDDALPSGSDPFRSRGHAWARGRARLVAGRIAPHSGGMLPPGPRLPSFVTTFQWLSRPYPFLEECRARYGEAFTLSIRGLPPLAFFSSPEDVKEVFADDGETLHAGEFNLSLRAFLGERSVLMLDGAEHLRHRRLLLPPFHGERMHAYGQTMLDAADASIDRWPLGRPFALHSPMQSITLDVILRTVFGVDGTARLAQFTEAITELLDIAAWPPLLVPAMQKDLGPLSPWGRYVRKKKASDKMIYAEIRERRAAGTKGRTDVLSMLLEARDESGQPMTDAELHDELVTLLVAGHETTATALAWTFRWLLDKPELAARVRRELEDAATTGPLAPERIAKLELLDAVARESLRLQPVIPIVGRILTRPARVGGYDLPAGCGVVCSIYLAQRRPASFPHPEEFDPDRFLGKKASPNEFFPFGGGIRRCIGMAFALYEMKMVLARVLTRAELVLDGSRPVRVVRRSITMTPSDGLRVRLTRRHARDEARAA